MSMEKGKVYLVGAGPGKADLITVRGAEVLRLADCVIYDRLVNPVLLRFAGCDAETIFTPKRVGAGSFTQEEINGLLVEKALAGKTVVRLKGGDPCVFGRAGEEIAVLVEAGIDFEVVPGVTAAVAAAEYVGILLTDRKYSSQLLFVTGHEADGKRKSNIDWQLLAGFGGTLVFYMAVGNVDFIVNQLISNGMDKEMPTAVITDATLPTQKVCTQPLRLLSEKCRQNRIEPPAIMVVGAVADSRSEMNWFMQKPLFGKNIVVTRDKKGNAEFADKIVAEGGNPIEFATIKIKSLTESDRFLRTFSKLDEFDWIVFTSCNGVGCFFDFLRKLGKDSRVFGTAKIAVIGSGTAAKLAEFGINADFVPDVFTAEQLGIQLIRFTDLRGKKILALRSKIALGQLPELLEQAGADVVDEAVYTTVTEKSDCNMLKEKIADGSIDWLTFASPSSARSFFEQIPVELLNGGNVKTASIGPVTSQQLQELGVRVDLTAEEHTTGGLLKAVKGTYE